MKTQTFPISNCISSCRIRINFFSLHFSSTKVIHLHIWVICVPSSRSTPKQKREWARARATENEQKKQMCSLIIEKHVVFKSPAIFYFVRAAFLLTAASAHAIDALRSDAQRELNLEFLKFLIFGIGAVSTNENWFLIFISLFEIWNWLTRNSIGNRWIDEKYWISEMKENINRSIRNSCYWFFFSLNWTEFWTETAKKKEE